MGRTLASVDNVLLSFEFAAARKNVSLSITGLLFSYLVSCRPLTGFSNDDHGGGKKKGVHKFLHAIPISSFCHGHTFLTIEYVNYFWNSHRAAHLCKNYMIADQLQKWN